MSGLTVFFHDNVERTYTDGDDVIYTTSIVDRNLSVQETLRLVPGGRDNWKTPRTVAIFPPGEWREVQFDYER